MTPRVVFVKTTRIHNVTSRSGSIQLHSTLRQHDRGVEHHNDNRKERTHRQLLYPKFQRLFDEPTIVITESTTPMSEFVIATYQAIIVRRYVLATISAATRLLLACRGCWLRCCVCDDMIINAWKQGRIAIESHVFSLSLSIRSITSTHAAAQANK